MSRSRAAVRRLLDLGGIAFSRCFTGDPAMLGEALRRLMGFFQKWNRLLDPADIIVVDPEIGHRHLRCRVLAAELGLHPLESVLEQRH